MLNEQHLHSFVFRVENVLGLSMNAGMEFIKKVKKKANYSRTFDKQ